MKRSTIYAGLTGLLLALAACSGGPSSPALPQSGVATGPQAFVLPNAAVKIASIEFGAIPAGTAGTGFGSAGKAIAVTAKDATGKKITGTYAHPILVTDSDKSGATSLTINGGSAAGGLKKSTDKLALHYSGLAIVPVTLTAKSTGAKTATATFSPRVPAIVYTGPTASPAPHDPEVDLYSNVPSTPGFSGNFTATQAGWTSAPFSKAFTYKFAAIAGQTNDCPGQSKPAFAITPASGSAGTAFTVSASTQLQAATNPGPFAGECMMTLTGGAGASKQVVLTYTTSGVVIGARHARVP